MYDTMQLQELFDEAILSGYVSQADELLRECLDMLSRSEQKGWKHIVRTADAFWRELNAGNKARAFAVLQEHECELPPALWGSLAAKCGARTTEPVPA